MSRTVLRSKVLVVGPPTVGKTSMVKCLTSDGAQFSGTYSMSLTAESSTKLIYNEEHNIGVEFFLFDISGSPTFDFEYPEIFKDANQMMIVFDITRADTLHQAIEWLDIVTKFAGRSLPAVLVGTKNDLVEFADCSQDECQNIAKEHGMSYFEVSAKLNSGIQDPFNELADIFIQQYENDVDLFINAE